MTVLRVVIADDHALVRAGVGRLLETLPHVQVLAEAADAAEALQVVERNPPDVLMLDLSMPSGGGLQVLEQVRARWPAVRVLVLSMHREVQYVRQALQLGAMGYLPKDSAPLELELALQALARNETYLSPSVSTMVVGDYVERLRAQGSTGTPLTPRQLGVLVLIAKGHSTKDIARLLNLSVKTIETHRTQLMKQLDVHEVTGLVRYAMRHGLLPPDA